MFVVGTAGHVDHGKSALVEALTGIHPDRLAEERERGLTIELGFAWLTLPSGREVSIVDVPGHVRFVRHMLAGVGAIDLAMFVIAADEGVMPQTREHLEILDLLDVHHGVVVLTKCDLVDDDWLELVEEDVRQLFATTSLAGSPIVRTSAVTGTGLDDLRSALDEALSTVPEPRDIGRPRFGIDRVFTMPGFGTVVTGTLLDGRVRVGDTLEAVPDGPTARVRGLQTHRREVEEALPGTRVAVNLSGVSTDDLNRGQLLARPGQLRPVSSLDARVRALEHRGIRHNLRVAVHLGAAETQGRVRVLGGPDEVPAGGEGWCQIVLAPPVAAAPGDLFVLRVSDLTLGGGHVVDVHSPRHRRTDSAVIARLEAHAEGTPESLMVATLERLEPCTERALAEALEQGADELPSVLAQLVDSGAVLPLRQTSNGRAATATLYITRSGLQAFADRARRALELYEREHPLRHGMSREELRSRLGLDASALAALLPALAPDIASTAMAVAREGWTPQLTAAQRRAADEAVTTLTSGGVAPPRLSLDSELIAYLEGAGSIVDCGDGVIFGAPAFGEARSTIVGKLESSGQITLAEARDALGTNRRATQALLERLDRDGVTARRGDARVLRQAPTGDAIPR